MRRTLIGFITTIGVLFLTVAPAKADIGGELDCPRCSLTYGDRDTWYTKCWSDNFKTRLEAKVDGRWVFYATGKPKKGYRDYSGDYSEKSLVCTDPEYPFIMTYTFTVKDEGELIQGGERAGQGLLPMREVYRSDGKTKYEYFKVYVS